MNKPEPPFPPSKWEFDKEYTEQSVIYKHLVHPDLMERDYDENYKDMFAWEEGDPLPEFIEFWYDNEMCTLDDIMKKIPVGTPLNNVVIHLKRGRQSDFVEFVVNVRNPTDKVALDNQYKEALKAYETKLEQYQNEVIAYQSWKTQEEIKSKEKEISDLKEQLAKLKK